MKIHQALIVNSISFIQMAAQSPPGDAVLQALGIVRPQAPPIRHSSLLTPTSQDSSVAEACALSTLPTPPPPEPAGEMPSITVTCIIRKEHPFDRDGIATAVARSRGCTVETVLAEWEEIAYRGTVVHDTIEQYFRTITPEIDKVVLVSMLVERAHAMCPKPLPSYYERCLYRAIHYVDALRCAKVVGLEFPVTISVGGRFEIRGKIDAVIQYSDRKSHDHEPKYLIVDWKTGKDKDMQKADQYRLQVRVYAYMYSVSTGVPIERMRCAVVYVESSVNPRIFLPVMTEKKMLELYSTDC